MKPVRDDARNDFEHEENRLIDELWKHLDTVEQKVAIGNLIVHYRSELVRQHYCTLAAAEKLEDTDVSNKLRVRDADSNIAEKFIKDSSD